MPISKSLPIFNLTPVILKNFFKHIFEMGVNRKLGNSAGNRLFKCDCFSRWDFVPLCKLYDFYKDIWYKRPNFGKQKRKIYVSLH